MKKIEQKLPILISAVLLGLLFSLSAYSAPANYTLFGDASLVSPGRNSATAARITSASTSVGYGGVDLSIPEGITFASLETLSTDYFIDQGDCGGGSPRFQINVIDPNTNTVKNIFVYIGPYPNYTTCAQQSWTNTGDLLDNGLKIDTSQLHGSFYQDYADAVAAFGTFDVTGIQLVVDSNQSVFVDNVVVNSSTYTFESANACKNGGWQSPLMPQAFKNQGDCVSYYAKGGQ